MDAAVHPDTISAGGHDVAPLDFLVLGGAIVLVASAVLACYPAAASLLKALHHRPVLPAGRPVGTFTASG